MAKLKRPGRVGLAYAPLGELFRCMTGADYRKPVSKLFTQGDCRNTRRCPDYLALGIGPEHVPDLVRMIQDDEFNHADP